MKSKTSDYKPRTLSRIDLRKSENVMIGSRITYWGIKKTCMSSSPQKVEDVKQLLFYQNSYDDNKNSVDGNQIVHDVGLKTTSTEISNSVSSSSSSWFSSSFPSSSPLSSSFSAKNNLETSKNTSSNIKQDIDVAKKSTSDEDGTNNNGENSETKLISNVDHNQGANHVIVVSNNSPDSSKFSEQNIISNENQNKTFNLLNPTIPVDTTPITKYSEKIMTVSQIPTSSSENNNIPSCRPISSKTVRTNLVSTHTCENETKIGMTSCQHLKALLSCPNSNNKTVMIFNDPTECIFTRHGFHRCWTCNYNHQHCIGGRKRKLECDECLEYCPVCTSRNTNTTTMGNHNTMSCHLNKHSTDDTEDLPPIVTTTTVPENLEQQQFDLIETVGEDFVKEKVMDDNIKHVNRKLTKTSQTQTNDESRVEPQRTTTEVCIKEIPIVKSGIGVTLCNINSSTTPTISNSNSKGSFTGGSVPNQNIAEASTRIDLSDFLSSSPLESSSKIPTVGNHQNQDQSLVNLGVQGAVPVPYSGVLRPSVLTVPTVQRSPQFSQPGPGSLSFSSLSKSIGMSSRVDQHSGALIGNKQLNPFTSISSHFVFPQPSQSSQLPNVGSHQQQHQSLVDLGVQGVRMPNVCMPAVQGASQFTPPGSSFRFRPQSKGSTLNTRQVQNSTIVYGSQQLNTPIRRSFVSSSPNQLFVKSPRFVSHQDQYQPMMNLGVQGDGRPGKKLESGLLRTAVAQVSSEFSNPTNNMRLFRPFAPSISSSRALFPVSHASPFKTYSSQSLSGNHGLNLFQSQSSRQIPISQASFSSENYYLDPHQQTQQIRQQLFHKQIHGSPQHKIPSTFFQKVHTVTEHQQQTPPGPIYQKQGQLVSAYQQKQYEPTYEQQGQAVPPYQQQRQAVPPYQQQGQAVPPYQRQKQTVPPNQQQGQAIPPYQQQGQLVPVHQYMVQPDAIYQQIMYQEQQPQEYPSRSSVAHGLRQYTTNIPSQSYIHRHIFRSEQSLQDNSRSLMLRSASHTNFGKESPKNEYEQFNPQGCKNSNSDTRVIPNIVTTHANRPEVSIPPIPDPSKASSNIKTNFEIFSKLSKYDNVPETCNSSVVDLLEKKTYFQKLVKINPCEIIVPISTTTKPPSKVSIKIEPGTTEGVPNPTGIPISISNNIESSFDDSISIIYEKIIPKSSSSSQQEIQSSPSTTTKKDNKY